MTDDSDAEGLGDSAVRARAEVLLDRNPHLSRAEFAGALLRETNTDPETASELYAELAEDSPGSLNQQSGGDPGDVLVNDDGQSADPDPPQPTPSDETDSSAGESLGATIEAHYTRLDEHGLYGSLGGIDAADTATDTRLSCLGNQDFAGWYRTREAAGEFDGEGRAYALAKEFGGLRDGLDRVLYATVNYAPLSWFLDAWGRYEWADGGRVWERGENPMPGYADLHAYAPFADIDLADDVKTDRPNGDVPTGDIEDALARYIDAFADLAGGREHVFALDSVGGAYVLIAPTATAPIANQFDGDDRSVLFDELTDRLNEWLTDVGERITEATGLGGVFEPDTVNHKNRLYKAPLAVHSSLDGVVTPIDRDHPRYEFTSLSAVGDDLLDATAKWCDEFTSDHCEAVDEIVATLWPDHYADAETWDSALAAWLDEYRTTQDQRDSDRTPVSSADIPDDLETTDDLNVLEAAIEGVDVEALATDLADGVVTDRDKTRFNPSWRPSSTGESCIVDQDKFADLKAGGGGGALKLVALDRGIITSATDDLTGNDYWRAVNALRDEGKQIPYYEGPDGRHPDVLRLFTDAETDEEKKRQLGRALYSDRS